MKKFSNTKLKKDTLLLIKEIQLLYLEEDKSGILYMTDEELKHSLDEHKDFLYELIKKDFPDFV